MSSLQLHRATIANHTTFSLHLMSQIASKARLEGAHTVTNLVISPLSIHVALSLLAMGSKTSEELVSFLKTGCLEETQSLISEVILPVLSDRSKEGGPRIRFANGVWLEKNISLKSSFQHLVQKLLKAEIQRLDFINKAEDCRDQVNSWVEERTDGLIKSILGPGSVDSLTRIIMGIALYFKENWLNEFRHCNSFDSTFHLLDGKSVEVPFMSDWSSQYIKCFDGFKVLKLPYRQGGDSERSFSMYMFLPDAKNGLWDLIEELSQSEDSFARYVPQEQVAVGCFMIPKFKFSYELEVPELLQHKGLHLPPLSEITESEEEVEISRIYHKAIIEVDETGTEAAAVTMESLEGCCLPEDEIDFVADHPFVFVIRENMSELLLFTGYIVDPSI